MLVLCTGGTFGRNPKRCEIDADFLPTMNRNYLCSYCCNTSLYREFMRHESHLTTMMFPSLWLIRWPQRRQLAVVAFEVYEEQTRATVWLVLHHPGSYHSCNQFFTAASLVAQIKHVACDCSNSTRCQVQLAAKNKFIFHGRRWFIVNQISTHKLLKTRRHLRQHKSWTTRPPDYL